MRRSSLMFAGISVALCGASIARAQPQPVQEELSLTALPLLPFGGEYLIAATWAGTITGAELHLEFTTAGEFQAENLLFEFGGPTGGVIAFGQTDFGWSGQGTFIADFSSNGLNGEIPTPGGGSQLSYWYMNIAPVLSSFPTPLEGELGESYLRITIQPCLVDWDGNYSTGVSDIFAFLTDWFAGAPNANIDGDGALGVGDIFRFLTLWFAGCNAF